jgi:hypothetical protein
MEIYYWDSLWWFLSDLMVYIIKSLIDIDGDFMVILVRF